jgi:hypothetical protein
VAREHAIQTGHPGCQSGASPHRPRAPETACRSQSHNEIIGLRVIHKTAFRTRGDHRHPLVRSARVLLLRWGMTHDDVFDDDTVIALVRADDPPALPFALRRRVHDDDAWLATLPPATRAVLEAARRGAPVHATALLPGAVVRPVPRIPSLRPPR